MILKEAADQRVGEAQDGIEALRKIKNTDCDVMLPDMNMPGRSGIDLLPISKRWNQKCTFWYSVFILKIILHSVRLKPEIRIFTCKYRSFSEVFVVAIRKIHSKGRYISNTLAEQLASVSSLKHPLPTNCRAAKTRSLIKIRIWREVKDSSRRTWTQH